MSISIQPNQDRIEVIDALRGFALAGIVIVHVVEQYFAGPPVEAITSTAFQGALDGFIAGMIGFFFQGKFFALFSLLFGLSFYIQMDRANQKGIDFSGRFLWRIVLLFAIGFVHSLFYRGDILTIYALVAPLLIPFYRLPNRVILGTAVFFFLGFGRYIVFALIGDDAIFLSGSMDFSSDEQVNYFNTLKNGSILDVFKANAINGNLGKLDFQFGIFNRGYLTFAYFLMGLWLGRIQLFRNHQEHKKTIRNTLFACIGLFVLGGVFAGVMFSQSGMTNETGFHNWFAVLGLTGGDFVNIGLTGVILCGFLLLYRLDRLRRFFNRLIPYGKTALTNYFLQSVIGTFLLFGWGLGWIGELRNIYLLLMAIAILIFQVLVSAWWLKSFRYGPLEWLWRSMTYFKWQPIRKD